jgi:hypothetical protein
VTTQHDERLHVPAAWWPGVFVIVVIGVLEVGSGFEWQVVLCVTAVIVALFALPLALSGRARVTVRDGVLRAGDKELPLAEVRSVQALDRPSTRLQLGPRADPAAVIVQRGWIGTSVLLPLAQPVPVPYWLVSTRHPEQLSAAIRDALATSQR